MVWQYNAVGILEDIRQLILKNTQDAFLGDEVDTLKLRILLRHPVENYGIKTEPK